MHMHYGAVGRVDYDLIRERNARTEQDLDVRHSAMPARMVMKGVGPETVWRELIRMSEEDAQARLGSIVDNVVEGQLAGYAEQVRESGQHAA